ncbi:hypothetical protein L1887_10203 [Cichorium endivia]|nr:hypothetical protein L1887_10203 [Cichorium endivia]
MVLLSSLIYAKFGYNAKRIESIGVRMKKLCSFKYRALDDGVCRRVCLLPSSTTIFCKTRGPNFAFSRPPTIVSPPVINTLASLRRFFHTLLRRSGFSSLLDMYTTITTERKTV